ncbi:MAG: Flp family type IVb pilin [Betaproteobacteria bacterium]|nr:Flp family type IVb pilin [Betaproteobacteria bacterium]NBU50772.1 Flp family type IVb pilin [Betaproteobacteria bacterium]
MIKALLSKFWNEEDGAAAIEYGLLAALIAATVAAGVNSVGNELVTIFSNVVAALKL